VGKIDTLILTKKKGKEKGRDEVSEGKRDHEGWGGRRADVAQRKSPLFFSQKVKRGGGRGYESSSQKGRE